MDVSLSSQRLFDDVESRMMTTLIIFIERFIVHKAKAEQFNNESKVWVLGIELSELRGKSHALPF